MGRGEGAARRPLSAPSLGRGRSRIGLLARLVRRARRAAPRFLAHRAGATAVEFAILSAPFLMLFCIVAETGFVAIAQQTFDLALDRGVRQLRTGAFQDGSDGSDPGDRFRRLVCAGRMVLFSCADLRLDVSQSTSFAAAQPQEPFDKDKKTWAPGFGSRFDCPQSGAVVSVRGAVPIPRLFRFMDFTGRIMSDQMQMLVSTEIFQAESYGSKAC